MRKNQIITFLVLLFCSAFLYAGDLGLKEVFALLKEGKVEESVSKLEKIAGEIPARFKFWVEHLERNGYFEKYDHPITKESLEKALKDNQNLVPAYYYLAMLFEKEEMNTKALNMWKKVLELSEDKDQKVLAEKHIKQLSK
ncbi:MAG: hypothetical protein LHV68_12725 [Elusimicrobia bacterium]|nr:hypothetical protein [Candidatus Liberimonas magnetica]